LVNIDFPAPLAPIMAVILPGENDQEIEVDPKNWTVALARFFW